MAKIEEKMKEVFSKYDADGSGDISVGELTALMTTLNPRMTPDACTKMFEAIDVNRDSSLQYTEFVDWVTGDDASYRGAKAAMPLARSTKKFTLISPAGCLMEHEAPAPPPPAEATSRKGGTKFAEAFANESGCLCCAPGVKLVDTAKAASMSFQLGEVTVNCITDGGVTVPATWMFNQKRDNSTGELHPWSQLSDEEIASFFLDGKAPLSFGCTLVQCAGVNIILDTSLGCLNPPIPPAMTLSRPLLDIRHVLETLGLAPNDINFVVHTHMHRDHTGWNVVKDEEGNLIPLFSNAKHVIQRVEWAYWTSSASLKTRVEFESYFGPLDAKGMIQLVDGNTSLCPQVSLQLAPGHTPGHQVARIDGGSADHIAYFVGDAFHQLAQICKPTWSPFFDWSPDTSASVREDLLRKISLDKALLLSPHFPYPGVVTVRQEGSEWAFDRTRPFDLEPS